MQRRIFRTAIAAAGLGAAVVGGAGLASAATGSHGAAGAKAPAAKSAPPARSARPHSFKHCPHMGGGRKGSGYAEPGFAPSAGAPAGASV